MARAIIPMLVATGMLLGGCGGGGGSGGGTGDGTGAAPGTTIAAASDVHYVAGDPGPTPFIQPVELDGNSLKSLTSIAYTIQPKSGTHSRPVHVTYSRAALQSRGYLETAARLRLPVFGLYAGYANLVSIELQFADDSVQDLPVTLSTAAYTDPSGNLDSPAILTQRQQDSALGFDFLALKPNVGSPVIVDTDGQVRWKTTGVATGDVSDFYDNGFVVGSGDSTQVSRVALDGSIQDIDPTGPGFNSFHHNIDPGRNALLAEIISANNVRSTITELDPFNGFGREWDLAGIIAAAMSAGGDDPTAFVRDRVDWFHSNSSVYRASDNTLVVSSRENFLIAVDYDSGAIKWILGDPAKYWYSFPSLRSKALTLVGGGDYPIGQHAVSITRDDLVMVFNNGNPSLNQPDGAPVGQARTYSTVSAYRIDAAAGTATEVWSFDYGQSIYSSLCGSAYEAPDGSVLIDYAFAEGGSRTRLVGLNSAHQVVFDIKYGSVGCNTSWNAEPVPLQDLRFD